MSMFDLHVPDSDDLGELDHLLFLALHIVSPISCVCQGILPRSTTLRCVQRTPISSTASSALTLTTGPMTLGSSGPIVSFEVSIISMMLVITSTPRSYFWLSYPRQYDYGLLVHTQPACNNVLSLASGFWTPARLGLHSFTRSVPTPMPLSSTCTSTLLGYPTSGVS
jgi:hypothetical protein